MYVPGAAFAASLCPFARVTTHEDHCGKRDCIVVLCRICAAEYYLGAWRAG